MGPANSLARSPGGGDNWVPSSKCTIAATPRELVCGEEEGPRKPHTTSRPPRGTGANVNQVVIPEPETAFQAWTRSISALTDSADSSRLWRERRYRFAHQLGEALVGPKDGLASISGPAVYGVLLAWRLLYIGQTTDAARRLRDLAVGESHRLGNTFPPETWHRIVVIAWLQLPGVQEAAQRHDEKTIGLALEHCLQQWAQPLANEARRTSGGTWRHIDRSVSTSRGAAASRDITELFGQVTDLWTAAEAGRPIPAACAHLVRTVHPSDLLPLQG